MEKKELEQEREQTSAEVVPVGSGEETVRETSRYSPEEIKKRTR